ncbi:glycosyltransferase [bacterium]|nr:glycosyltransferase [bacterium]
MQIAVIIPAYNEEVSVAQVVTEFKSALPEADIYVGDNNSVDATAEKAKEAGATVVSCRLQGKGYAVRHMLEEIDADIYIMVDADLTYSAENIRDLIKPVAEHRADMVVGLRQQVHSTAFSFTHRIGNFLLTHLLNKTFKVQLKDILSGYRILSRELVDNLVLLSEGFEIEVELTIRSLEERYRILEMPINYRSRISGSESKLSTWSDGFLIFYTIITLFRDYNPMNFFVILSLIFFITGSGTGISLIIRYLQTGLMQHTGLAIITAICILLSVLLFLMGLLLDSSYRSWRMVRKEMQRLRQLIKDEHNR